MGLDTGTCGCECLGDASCYGHRLLAYNGMPDQLDCKVKSLREEKNKNQMLGFREESKFGKYGYK